MNSFEVICRDALALPEAEREVLMRVLMESLEPVMSPEEERAFDEELERRLEDLTSGRVVGLTIEETFAQLDASLAAIRSAKGR